MHARPCDTCEQSAYEAEDYKIIREEGCYCCERCCPCCVNTRKASGIVSAEEGLCVAGCGSRCRKQDFDRRSNHFCADECNKQHFPLRKIHLCQNNQQGNVEHGRPEYGNVRREVASYVFQEAGRIRRVWHISDYSRYHKESRRPAGAGRQESDSYSCISHSACWYASSASRSRCLAISKMVRSVR